MVMRLSEQDMDIKSPINTTQASGETEISSQFFMVLSEVSLITDTVNLTAC